MLATPSAAQPSATSPTGLDDEARREFGVGAEAYDQGHFADALTHFERAYQLSAHPKLLFNIARAAEQDGKFERAVATYEKYLRAFPEAENRAFVRGRVSKLHELVGSSSTRREEPALAASAPVRRPEATQPTTPSGSYDRAATDASLRSLAGTIQLSLATPLLRYGSLGIDGDIDSYAEANDSSFLLWGFTGSVSVGVAYAVTDSWLVGARAMVGGSRVDTWHHTSISAGPCIDYMFRPSARWRPHIGADALFGGTWSRTSDESEKSGGFDFGVAARVGVRAFVTDSFSIDPSFIVGLLVSKRHVVECDVCSEASWDQTGIGYQLGMDIALSGWLGG